MPSELPKNNKIFSQEQESRRDAYRRDAINIFTRSLLFLKGPKAISAINSNKNLVQEDCLNDSEVALVTSKLSSIDFRAKEYFNAHQYDFSSDARIADEMNELFDDYENALIEAEKLNEKLNQRGKTPKMPDEPTAAPTAPSEPEMKEKRLEAEEINKKISPDEFEAEKNELIRKVLELDRKSYKAVKDMVASGKPDDENSDAIWEERKDAFSRLTKFFQQNDPAYKGLTYEQAREKATQLINEQHKKDAESGGEENPEVKIDARLKDKIDILKSKGKVVSELNRNKNLTDQDKSKLSSVYQKANDYYAAHLRELDNPQVVDEMMMLLDNYEQALDKITKLNEKINQRGIIPEAAEGTSDKIAPEDEISWEDAEEELQKQREEFQAQREKELKHEQAEPTIDKFIQSTSNRRASRDRAMEAATRRDEQKREELERDNKFLQITREGLKQSENDNNQLRKLIEENEERYKKEIAGFKGQIKIAREEGEEEREALEKENTDLKEKLRLATGKAEKMENDLQKLRENADKYMELAEKAKNQPDVQGKKLERPIGEIIDQKKLEKLVTLAQVFWREMEAEAGNSAYINKYGPDKPLLFRIEARSYIRDLITEKRLISNSEDLETVVGYVLDKVKPE